MNFLISVKINDERIALHTFLQDFFYKNNYISKVNCYFYIVCDKGTDSSYIRVSNQSNL